MREQSLSRFFTWSISAHIVLLMVVCIYMFFDLDVDLDNSPKSNVSVTVVYDTPAPIVKAVAPVNPATTNAEADIKIADNNPKAAPIESKEINKKAIPIKELKPVVNDTKSQEILKFSKEKQKVKDKNPSIDPNKILNDAKTEGLGDNGHSEYIATIVNIVRPEVIPEDIDQETTLVVKIKLKKDMSLKSIEVKKYSSNEQYNQAIIQKLKSIKKFPALPEGAQFKEYKTMVFTFSPKQGG